MRNTILLILLMSVLFACSDDDNGGFDVEINEDMFSFTPTEGGAIMRYNLADRRVNKVSVNIRTNLENLCIKLQIIPWIPCCWMGSTKRIRKSR